MDIIYNTRVAKVLITGKSQFKALKCEMPLIEFDTIYINQAIICFRSKTFLSFINIIKVDILDIIANFYIVITFIPFLFILKNIDILNIYLNNIIN